MAASDYVPTFKNRLHLAGRPQMSTRPRLRPYRLAISPAASAISVSELICNLLSNLILLCDLFGCSSKLDSDFLIRLLSGYPS